VSEAQKAALLRELAGIWDRANNAGRELSEAEAERVLDIEAALRQGGAE
jgi:hypothetical protein